MINKQNIYDDGQMKIELAGALVQFIETDEKIAKLDMHQRIRILEFVSGIRDISEIRDSEEAKLVMRVLCEKLMGHISSELNPDKWHLPESPKDEHKKSRN